MDDGTPADCLGVAACLHAGHHRVAPRGLRAKTQDKRSGRRAVNSHARHDERPGTDSGWPTFSGKYVEYPRFRKEWWAYRQTYHGHVRDQLVCCSLKEWSLTSSVRLLVNDIDDLREAWNTLDTCFD